MNNLSNIRIVFIYVLLNIVLTAGLFAQSFRHTIFKEMFQEDIGLLSQMSNYSIKTSDHRIYDKSSFTCDFVYAVNGTSSKYLLIVDSYVYASTRGYINRYATDINNAYDYTVVVYVVENEDHTDVKELIQYEKNNLIGVTFIGDIDEAYFEMVDDDDEYISWICDLYYMDIDGEWMDNDNNGIYDAHIGDVKPDIFVGRISAKHMGTAVSETEGLTSFFNKDHEYWIGRSQLNKKYSLAYTNEDWVSYSQFDDTKELYGSSNNDIYKYGNPSFSKSDYLNRLQNNRYEFIQLAAHSNPHLHKIVNEYAYSYEIFEKNTKAYGLNLFCCSACDWGNASPSSGYIAGAYLYNSNSRTLALVGSTKTGSMYGFKKFYIPLGQGNSIGYSLKQWWIDQCGNSHDRDDIEWFYGIVILGDPLVSFHYDSRMQVSDNLDLYIKDDPNDFGVQPNNTAQYLYVSEDIWVRNQRDGLYNQTTENPNYGNPNHVAYVYVRVRNNSTIASSGTEQLVLSWAKAGIDLYWPYSWQSNSTDPVPMGALISTQTIPALMPGESCVIEFEWQIPDPNMYEVDKWHFCLLAQVDNCIQDPLIGKYIPQPTWQYASYNNNVAWKNVSIININYPIAFVRVFNPQPYSVTLNIIFVAKRHDNGWSINDVGEVNVSLDEGLYTLWENGGGIQNGLKKIDGYKFRVLSDEAVLSNITLPPNSSYLIGANAIFYTQLSDSNFYIFDILEEIDEVSVGGEQYVVYKDQDIRFKAVALEDQTIFAGDSANLVAVEIEGDANYLWYNQSGDTVAIGLHFNPIQNSSGSYILEVVDNESGYKDFDTVTVSVINGAIISLTPNPANGQTMMEYRLSNMITSANVVVTNALGAVAYTSLINISSTSHIIPLQGITAGQYIVRLESQGNVLDFKTLIVQ